MPGQQWYVFADSRIKWLRCRNVEAHLSKIQSGYNHQSLFTFIKTGTDGS